jgi:hypothetical protein
MVNDVYVYIRAYCDRVRLTTTGKDALLPCPDWQSHNWEAASYMKTLGKLVIAPMESGEDGNG